MEFRTEYNLTLTTGAGRALVKALVEYHETVLGTATTPGSLPTVFEVPGVLRIDNLIVIESHTYESVLNPVHSIFLHERPEHLRKHGYRYDPREAALREERALNVRFVVWQRAPESVNT